MNVSGSGFLPVFMFVGFISLDFFYCFYLGFVKPICRARMSKMAQLALKVGDTNSNSPCLSNLDFILIMASNKLLHWLFFSLFFFILFWCYSWCGNLVYENRHLGIVASLGTEIPLFFWCLTGFELCDWRWRIRRFSLTF